jgi:hypothetical protein
LTSISTQKPVGRSYRLRKLVNIVFGASFKGAIKKSQDFACGRGCPSRLSTEHTDDAAHGF